MPESTPPQDFARTLLDKGYACHGDLLISENFHLLTYSHPDKPVALVVWNRSNGDFQLYLQVLLKDLS